MRYPTRDKRLPHQIILRTGGNSYSVVTCNCWAIDTDHNMSMGTARTVEEAWTVYRDPTKHRNVSDDHDAQMKAL